MKGKGIGHEEALKDDHQFDRRKRDVNVQALADRVTGLEGRVEGLELATKDNSRELHLNSSELKANTQLTKQVHEAVFGREDAIGVFGQTQQLHAAVFGREGEEEDGMRAKVKEVHGFFSDAKRGFAMLNRVADTVTRWGKPIVYVLAVGTALGVLVKTGEWKWPPW